ncbi:MAG: hypothetical protein FJY91_00830 [Candidatus Harrisonbacteria bacterium]|nr:hypothetical protein [Candidatus Harrisonbacteria bacterium]
MFRNFFLILLIFSFLLQGYFPVFAITAEERKILEDQLNLLDKQISETEAVVTELNKQGKSLKTEVEKYNKDISKSSLKIKAIGLTINKLSADIEDNKDEVVVVENKLDRTRDAIRSSLQSLSEKESDSLFEILIQSPTLSDFFSGMNGFLDVSKNLSEKVEEAEDLRNDLLDKREELSLKKSDQESLKSEQDAIKKELEQKKKEKNNLLEVTKGKESKYKEVLAVTKKTAAEIRNRIFQFAGGGEMTFEQAYTLAKTASGWTGVRPALLLAVLDKESALGKNVGRCSYETAMHPTRDIPIFLEITASLGIDPQKQLVSCAITSDGAYGGAMGPSQFIPSTWNLYKDRVSSLTGNTPPSPWRNLDAFVATALYLKDARESSACVAYGQEIPSQSSVLQDRCAAAKYYAGSRWRTYRFTYGDRVLKHAEKFEEDIRNITQ